MTVTMVFDSYEEAASNLKGRGVDLLDYPDVVMKNLEDVMEGAEMTVGSANSPENVVINLLEEDTAKDAVEALKDNGSDIDYVEDGDYQGVLVENEEDLPDAYSAQDKTYLGMSNGKVYYLWS